MTSLPPEKEAPPVVGTDSQRLIEPIIDEIRAELAATPVERGSPIHGVLLDSRGLPLPGVTVGLRARRLKSPKYPSQGRARTPEGELARARYFIDGELWSETRGLRATSNANGRLVFDDAAADARYSVDPDGGDGAMFEFVPQHFEVRPGGTFTLFAYRIANVEFDIRKLDGSVPETANLELIGPRMNSWSAWQPSAPTKKFRMGTYAVCASVGSELKSAEVVLEVFEGQAPARVELVLESRNGIRGRVEARPGDRNDIERVFYRMLEAGEPANPQLLIGSAEIYASENKFEILDLPAGRYLVGVSHREHIPDVVDVIEVTNGIAELTLRYPEPSDSETIAVHVSTPSGEAVKRVAFRLRWREEKHDRWCEFPSREIEGGYQLVINETIRRELAKPGRQFGIGVAAAGLGVREVPIESTPPSAIRVEFAPSAICELEILPGGGERDPESVVLLVSSAEHDAESWMGQDWIPCQVPGKCSPGLRESGSYRIRIARRTSRNDRFFLCEQVIELPPGESTRQLTLPACHRLVVNLTCPPAERERCWLKTDGAERRHVDVYISPDRLEDRRAEFEVPAGSYVFMYSSTAGDGEMPVEVASNAEVEFTHVEPNALLVEITQQSGFLAAVGLGTGDLILEIDGVRFAGKQSLEKAYYKLRALSVSRLLVLRDGEEFELSLPEGQLPDHLGGDLKHHVR